MTRLFGTDGIRGRAGEAPLDEATVRKLGRALGVVLSEDFHHPARLVVGRDTRESGPVLLRALAAGLREAGALVRSAGVIPTGNSRLSSGTKRRGASCSSSTHAWACARSTV